YELQIERAAVEPLLRVEDLQIEGALRDISFELWPHEILGFAGRLGSGRTELALALFGVLPIDGGQIYVNGQPVRLHSIQDAMKHGIGYVPEDRLTEGLFLEQSVSRNIVLGMIDRVLGTANLIDADKMRSQVRRWVGNLSIMTPSIEAPVKTLFGGNQQRVVLAKWLASRPKVLILNGPTVGVDVGSKSELHELMIELAREGIGLIVISDEIPELMHTTNRIFYMDGGRIVEQFNTEEVTENELSRKLRQVQT
ncbi:MAG: ATP-binding cassette domain-containing protein, partial [Chloroflexota bacterium]